MQDPVPNRVTTEENKVNNLRLGFGASPILILALPYSRHGMFFFFLTVRLFLTSDAA